MVAACRGRLVHQSAYICLTAAESGTAAKPLSKLSLLSIHARLLFLIQTEGKQIITLKRLSRAVGAFLSHLLQKSSISISFWPKNPQKSELISKFLILKARLFKLNILTQSVCTKPKVALMCAPRSPLGPSERRAPRDLSV